MWPKSIPGRKTSIRKRGRVTGDSSNSVEIVLSHLRKVSGPASYGQKTKRYGKTSYVASVGTCQVISNRPPSDMNTSHIQGDSGGPAFVEESKERFVVTGGRSKMDSSFAGVVSGGRGTLGECGGINNPIHYVRVKKFNKWILGNLGKKER